MSGGIRPFGALAVDEFGRPLDPTDPASPVAQGPAVAAAAGRTWPARAAAGALDAARLPGRVYRGEVDPTSEEGIGQAFDMAGLLTTGALPMAQAGAAGIFGGRLAATADRGALRRAESMAGAGADRRAIWDETGWFRGADDAWRFEIPDEVSLYAPQGARTIGDALLHPDLVAAYPTLTLAPFREADLLARGARGSFSPTRGIAVDRSLSAEEGRSVALHEMQHAVQEAERFASGSSPHRHTQQHFESETVHPLDRRINDLMQQYPDAANAYRARNREQIGLLGRYGDSWGAKATDEELAAFSTLEDKLHALPGGSDLSDADWRRMVAAMDARDPAKLSEWQADRYRRAAGEVEARNVQARRDMTPDQRRAVPPWETQDVPDAQQVFGERAGPALLQPFGALPFFTRGR